MPVCASSSPDAHKNVSLNETTFDFRVLFHIILGRDETDEKPGFVKVDGGSRREQEFKFYVSSCLSAELASVDFRRQFAQLSGTVRCRRRTC